MAAGYLTTDDGIRLYFETAGTGPELVLFPNGRMMTADFAPLTSGRTLVFYDPRNRGRSDLVDPQLPSRGVHDDVSDLDAVRRHFDVERVALFGHSYMGVTVALYAIAHASRVSRVIQMSPSEPRYGTTYAPDLCHADDLLRDTRARLGALQAERSTMSAVEFCRKFWSILTPIYVADPAHVQRIRWARCEEPNELGFMSHWVGRIVPSLEALALTPAAAAAATVPVLVVHGRRDRSAAYGGAREWAGLLPDARLLTIEQAAHTPWLERPDEVIPALAQFLDGQWPAWAEVVPRAHP